MAKKKVKAQEEEVSYGSFGPRTKEDAAINRWPQPVRDYIRCSMCGKAISTCEFDFNGGSVPRYVPCCDDCSEEEIDPLDAFLKDLRKMVNPERPFDMHGFATKMLSLMELIVERLQEDDD